MLFKMYRFYLIIHTPYEFNNETMKIAQENLHGKFHKKKKKIVNLMVKKISSHSIFDW